MSGQTMTTKTITAGDVTTLEFPASDAESNAMTYLYSFSVSFLTTQSDNTLFANPPETSVGTYEVSFYITDAYNSDVGAL